MCHVRSGLVNRLSSKIFDCGPVHRLELPHVSASIADLPVLTVDRIDQLAADVAALHSNYSISYMVLFVAVSLNSLFSIRHSSRVRRLRQPTLYSLTFMSELASTLYLVKRPGAARCPRSTICCSCAIHSSTRASLCCGPLNICGLVTSVTSSFMQPSQF